ncbi:MAG TPA: 5-oxoprolinase subunit PxpA [Paenibacillus sp.]|uniref:5-oxoprolinase subunit PxpA n=1 Tax=Paenibacillus sp. TaxID=58172 RepID=UPI0028D8747E|nr:5-oxoprolinase subunit PxpA [Paenibacillus sp.]HUC91803.1 5-oxoprolinase subunit PxpA [Paenibacillus sp.]
MKHSFEPDDTGLAPDDLHTHTARLRVDLNCDLGEGCGAYSFGQDEALLGLVSSANIACGFHAGDPHTMRAAVISCIEHNVAIGAHPGLPDRLGFGRREMAVTPEEVYDFVVYQTGALQAIVHAQGGKLRHVKPHGALYHMANRQEDIAQAIVKAVNDIGPGIALFAQAGSLFLNAAEAAGLQAVSETFADRRYMPDGSLMPRSHAGALLSKEEAVRQACMLAESGKVVDASGGILAVRADTICVHGDGAEAVELAVSIRKAFGERGIRLFPPTVNG